MTETDWLEWACPDPMLAFLGNKASPRKLRLFACACYRRIWHLIEKEGRFSFLLTAENFADGLTTLIEVHAAIVDNCMDVEALALLGICFDSEAGEAAGRVSRLISEERAAEAMLSPSRQAWYAARTREEAERILNKDREVPPEVRDEWAAQATLIRHLFGNIFQPYSATGPWPTTIINLAKALYDGQDCLFALQDGLSQAGYADLANHFRARNRTPKDAGFST